MLDFIRRLFVWFDVAVYGVVESIFQVIVDLANIQLFNDTVIDQFASRLYIILGLVMLFKIMISFVQMLINPDKMDDKEQGVTSLLKRVVISLALIVLVPSIFDLARQVQTELLPVIPKVVLGVESDLTSEDSEAMNSVGRVMSFYTFLAFFNYDNQNCDDGSILGTGSRLDIEHQFQQPATIVSVGTAYTHVNDKCPASTDANGYRYKYNVLLSTIVGAYLLFVLVQIAVKIAIRTLKLGICEFVAPIPIASYIDPKMSKQTFDTWVNTCWKTYLDLFIRLIIVYFMIFVFQTVLTNDFLTALYGKLGGSIIRGSLVTVFIIVGVLQFAKEAPKFIGDMLGLKADGDLMGMFKDAWESAKTVGSLPVAGARASMLASAKSKEAGESEEVQRYRARMAAMSASGRFIADRLKGKKLKESASGSIEKALSGVSNGISRAAGYATPGIPTTMSDVRRARSGSMAARTRSFLGQSQKVEAFDNRIKNFEKVANMVSDGRKSMSGHKLAKAYRERYEAIKNTSEEVYQQQIRSSISREINQLEEEYTNPDLTLTTERRDEITSRLNALNTTLDNETEIRNRARNLKFQETNDASRAVDDVQKRLFEFAMKGNTEENFNSVFNAEDRRILDMIGLSREDTWRDGEIMQSTQRATFATQTAINNSMMTDPDLRNAYGGEIRIENMNVSQAGKLKDKSVDLKSELENNPEYIRAKADATGIKTGSDK